MEKDIFKPSVNEQKEKETLYTSNDESNSLGNKPKSPPKKKEVNSWDCSTPTNNGKTSNRKMSDWDSSSECQETMVEPFDSNENQKECENWDSENEKESRKVEKVEKVEVQGGAREFFLTSSLESYELSLSDLSDVEKSSLMEIIGSSGGRNVEKRQQEELLLVEDLEEFLRDENSWKVSEKLLGKKREGRRKSGGSSDIGTESEKVRSNHSEGTREDTTIWMIPKSERTQSGESTSKLISSSERKKIEKLNVLKNFLKKTKSCSDVQKSKIRRRTGRSSRSDYLGSQKNNYNHFLTSEGSHLQRKLEIESKKTKENLSGRENFDRSSVFFTEYECRAMTIEKDTPEKQSVASESVINSTDMLPEAPDITTNGNPPENDQDNATQISSETAFGEYSQPGPSDNVFLDVVSLPDMTKRNSFEEHKKEGQRVTNSEIGGFEKSEPVQQTTYTPMSESWFLLDSTGHYQPVTRTEVSILLNGRSADAVLQGRKEHVIPKATLNDTKSLRDSLSCMQTAESLQHFLKEEDTGGEDEGKKSIELERKVENTLFYIQPNMNFTASIRIIPVDSEMIHIWRRTRGSGSLISSEVDLSYPSQDSVDNNPRVEHPASSVVRRPLEQTPEQDENHARIHHSLYHRPCHDYSQLLMETRRIVDSLSDNFKAIQKKLDGETSRSLALQGEVNDLRLLLKQLEDKFPTKCSRGSMLQNVPETVEEDSKPEVRPDIEVQPEIKARSDVEAQLDIEGRPDIKAPSNFEARSDIKAPSNTEVRSDIKAPSNTEARSDIKAPSNFEARSDIEARPDIKAPSNTEARPNIEARPDIEAQPDVEVQPNTEAQPDIEAPSNIEARPDSEAQPEIGAQSDIEARPDIETRPNIWAQPDIEAQPEIGAQSSIWAQPDIAAQPDIEDRPDIKAQPDIEDRPDIKAQPDIEDRPGIGVQSNIWTQPDIEARPNIGTQANIWAQPDIPDWPYIGARDDTDDNLHTATVSDIDLRPDIRTESIPEEVEDVETPKCRELEVQTDSKIALDKSKSQFADRATSFNCCDDNDVITVNIYTVDSSSPIAGLEETQETCSLVQTNLTMIDNKMRRLQQENDIVMKQNMNLKKKLREISMELEKYLAGTSQQDFFHEESREVEMLRDQVCNLKLELENLKNAAGNREEELIQENYLMQQEFAKIIFSLKDWCVMAGEIFEKIQTATSRLQEGGITIEVNLQPESIENPKSFSNLLTSYIEKTLLSLFAFKDENNFYEQVLKKNSHRETPEPSKEISGLDQVISGYAELIDQCRKGQMAGDAESKVMEDYFTVMMEKASLMEEIKILKTENEMLLESQMEHYEKLKQTMIALKDRKSEISALETSQKLSDDERLKMGEMLKLYEREKEEMKTETMKKSKAMEELIGEMEKKEEEIRDLSEKLTGAVEDIKSLEKSCRLKDELIKEIKIENEELSEMERKKNNQIEILKEEIKNLEMRGTQLEAELTSSKLFLNESKKEMTDYISHLEALVSNSQDMIDKTKQKLKESHQTISRLKNEIDVLDKQHQCDVKLFNATKDELDSCKDQILKTNNKLKELEEEREELLSKLGTVTDSEKEKSKALELLAREYKTIFNENADLKGKVDTYSRDKEESLKEQKDLINKYSSLSKEMEKLQEKYRSVKNECNQRTDLIRYLEMMLKENLVEYNSRIAGLEQHISRIIEKIVACKNGMREKNFGVDAEVRELRHQLDVTYRERKELENVVDNYYSLMKHLENEIKEREKKVDELHVKLSLEQQKAMECDNARKSCQCLAEPQSDSECARIEQLENQIAVTENELAECKKELNHCQNNYENEKKKLELTIADLKSEIKRYQLRIEVMMRNLTNCNKNLNGMIAEKKNGDDSDVQALKKELEEKNKLVTELNETINKYKAEVKLKESDLENSKKRSFYLNEELKNLQNQIAKMQGAISATNKTNETQQKERDEMAEKLFQSIKLVMEERSTRQTIESLAVEKEKNYTNQMDQIKNELLLKSKECESLAVSLDDKKAVIVKLQRDLKKMKWEAAQLKGQVSEYKKKQEGLRIGEEQASPGQMRSQNVSSERFDSCLRELKEVRDLNLELRKQEGQYQAKIVRLEDEIRDARLLIKELQGDIKTEKKSKKALKNMILAAKMEVEKCVMAKQLLSVVAERISRHLDISEIPSRELLSGFRLSDSSSSSKICT